MVCRYSTRGSLLWQRARWSVSCNPNQPTCRWIPSLRNAQIPIPLLDWFRAKIDHGAGNILRNLSSISMTRKTELQSRAMRESDSLDYEQAWQPQLPASDPRPLCCNSSQQPHGAWTHSSGWYAGRVGHTGQSTAQEMEKTRVDGFGIFSRAKRFSIL
jgi:hypothetical protein